LIERGSRIPSSKWTSLAVKLLAGVFLNITCRLPICDLNALSNNLQELREENRCKNEITTLTTSSERIKQDKFEYFSNLSIFCNQYIQEQRVEQKLADNSMINKNYFVLIPLLGKWNVWLYEYRNNLIRKRFTKKESTNRLNLLSDDFTNYFVFGIQCSINSILQSKTWITKN
jgi:hypothetical protein